MAKKTNTNHFITPAQLCVGLYVHLDVGWMDHPFTFSNFKIQETEQIGKINAIGLKKLRYDPLRSDVKPLSLEIDTPPEQPQEVTPTVDTKVVEEPVNHKTARLIQLHQAIEENEAKFKATNQITKAATTEFLAKPEECIAKANSVVSDMVNIALTESDVAIHTINQQDESDYNHSLNVMVLSLMLSKTLDLSKEDAQTLGIAALFHDIGHLKIDPAILGKTTHHTEVEIEKLQAHTVIGAQMALDAGLPEQIAEIILSHHEKLNGSGYPRQLSGDKVNLLSRILSLVNSYDNMCNPQDINQARTPYESLAHLFAHQRHEFDEVILKRMIKTLGIYPPGSMIQLSTGEYANVISGNISHPLRPFVMLYEAGRSNQEPKIIDLREELSINISICLRPKQLPPEVLEYFNPSMRTQFYLETALPELLNQETAELVI